MTHIPVLLKETIEILKPGSGEFFIDGTLGNAGHAKKIIERIKPNGIFLGVDRDEGAIINYEKQTKNQKNLILIRGNYADLPEILKRNGLPKADGLLLDLGFSSDQIEKSHRGFSFLRDEALLMTYDINEKPAYEWLKDLNEEKLTQIIKEFGEERFAARIAKAIKKNLPIATSGKLSEVIKAAVPINYERGRIHPATRTFLAIRIFVNRELENLKTLLDQIPNIMRPEGRVVIISFHSLEDRIVKNAFRNLAKNNQVTLLTKKPISPTREEIIENPRARSAKLRAIKITKSPNP